MAQISRLLWRVCLVVQLCAVWMLGTDADIIHESCRDVKVLDANGRETASWGDLTRDVDEILRETKKIVTSSYKLMEDIEDGKADWFDRARAKRMLRALQVQTGRQSIIDEQSWIDTIDAFGTIQDFLGSRATQPTVVVCGDAHLEKFWILDDEHETPVRRIPRGARVKGFKYRDHFIERRHPDHGEQWQPLNQGACRDSTSRKAFTKKGVYMAICPNVLDPCKSDFYTIGNGNRDTNWGGREYAGEDENYLDYWKGRASVYVFHEFFHLLLHYRDWPLRRPVQASYRGRTLQKAYMYDGSVALLEQNPEAVSTNVENKVMVGLAIFMDCCSWDRGTAVSKRTLARELGRDGRS